MISNNEATIGREREKFNRISRQRQTQHTEKVHLKLNTTTHIHQNNIANRSSDEVTYAYLWQFLPKSHHGWHTGFTAAALSYAQIGA